MGVFLRHTHWLLAHPQSGGARRHGSRGVVFAVLAAAINCCAASVCAYTGALNLIPTTDMAGNGNVRLSCEWDKMRHSDTSSIYSQIGIGPRLEAGVDIYGAGGDNTAVHNVKALLMTEKGSRPAVAAGIWNAGEGVKPTWYVTGCRTAGNARLHIGVHQQSNAQWLAVGSDLKLTDRLLLMADWQTGPGRCHTAGVYWQTTPALGITVYGARNNTHELRESADFIGFNAGWTISAW